MRYVLEDIQGALYKLLHAALPSRKILTALPPVLNDAPPFILIAGEQQNTQDQYKGMHGYRVTISLEAWTQTPGSKELVHLLMKEIFSALDNGTFDLAPFSLTLIEGKMGLTDVAEMPGNAFGVFQHGITQLTLLIEDQLPE